MTFCFPYTIRLCDTDAAGVVYFSNILNFCHQAYESALATAGIAMTTLISNDEFSLPITACHAQFKRPLYCGCTIVIEIQPDALTDTSFALNYVLWSPDRDRCYGTAHTQHTCIHPRERQRRPLPDAIAQWYTHLTVNSQAPLSQLTDTTTAPNSAPAAAVDTAPTLPNHGTRQQPSP